MEHTSFRQPKAFFFSKAIFSIHSQASHVLERYYAPFWAQGHHIFAFEWNVLCNQDKILLSAYYERGTVKQFDICHLTFSSHTSLDVNKVADLSRLVRNTCLCRGALAINSGLWQTLAWRRPATKMLPCKQCMLVNHNENPRLYFLHGQTNIKAEVRRWKMTDLKIIAELFH